MLWQNVKIICLKLKKMIKTFLLSLVLIIIPLHLLANNKELPVPRFASIKSNEVNARTGPSIKSPIEWVFIKKGEPVEIIAQYEQWRQIRDIKGEGGWVHLSVLSGKRTIIIIGNEIIPLINSPSKPNEIVVKLAPGVRCQLKKCSEQWCLINCKGYKGWIQRKFLWGVYKNEEF